ncbi:MAG: hypothetical protein EPO32_07620 [Anaerolineae bacterium]|nr:MAG: hypothetical protein EPO32_07620 [Anaerolineae bacterium]
MKPYARQFIFAMLAYAALVVAAVLLTNQVGMLQTPARAALALLPLIPAVFVMRAVVAGISSLDELQRRIHLEALTFAFVAHFFFTLTYSLLSIVPILAPSLGVQILQMAVLWNIGLWLARRKYAL